jgi:hypothetical protein
MKFEALSKLEGQTSESVAPETVYGDARCV